MTYEVLKTRHPVVAALLRKEFVPCNAHFILCCIDVHEIDGDFVGDCHELPEPIVLRAGSREWVWLED